MSRHTAKNQFIYDRANVEIDKIKASVDSIMKQK